MHTAIRAWAGVSFGTLSQVYVVPGRARPRVLADTSKPFDSSNAPDIAVGASCVVWLAKLYELLESIPAEVRVEVVGMLLGIV